MPTRTDSRRRRDDGMAAWAAFLRAHVAVVDRLEAHLAATKGMPLSWYDVLLELGHRAVLSRSRVSRVVDELVTEGLVRRERDPHDRRCWYAVLTPEGRNQMRRAAPAYVRGIEENFTRHLSDDELAIVRSVCLRLVED